MGKILKISFDIIFIVLIILLSLYLILRFFGITGIYEVKTGSMEDGIHAGDYILIVKKNDYKVGDVVTYKNEDYHVTHRIIKKNGNKVITKGDANNVSDEEIKVSSIIGKVIMHGGILNILIDFKFVIAGGLLGLYLLTWYFGRKEQVEESKE